MDKHEDFLCFKIYNSEVRTNVIKFCGWTDYLKPTPALNQ